MKFTLCIFLTVHVFSFLHAQDSTNGTSRRQVYQQTFQQIERYIIENKTGDFKESVFLVENAFLNNSLDVAAFGQKIHQMAVLIKGWARVNSDTRYKYADSVNMKLNQGIYTLMKDSITLIGPVNTQPLTTIPFVYDFDDYAGIKDHTKMFVSKLLYTYSGNCHNLPYLYKILADETGATCWLSFAPNHIYIKNRSKQFGWYNTELTSGSFPIDAWITASGYIPLQAIQNGIYMDTLSNRQAIALCVLDLAKGYEFQTRNYEDGFILKCCDLVLQYHPVNAQALLLKAEILKRMYEKQVESKNETAQATYKEMEGLYVKLFDLGYREMPESMYLDWLKSVSAEGNKYNNTKLNKASTPSKK